MSTTETQAQCPAPLSPTASGPDATDSDVASLTGQRGSTGVYSLSAGENNLTVDAGLIPLLGSIGNFVWKDNNANNLQDPSEPGVANITVELFGVVGNVTSTTALQTITTGANGFYNFAGLPTGDYQVKFTLPASETLSCEIVKRPNTGTDDTRDSDVDPLTGFSPVVTINPGGTGLAMNNPTIDLGLQRKIYDPIGYIYRYETNTILTGGIISVSGPGSISIIKNGFDGAYQFFTDGIPGSYTLSYSHPNGYSIATAQRPVAGTAINPTLLEGTSADRDGMLNGWVRLGSLANSSTAPTSLIDGSAAGNPYYLVFNLMAGDPYVSENNLPIICLNPLGSIGDLVWKDVTQDGRYDASTELGTFGITVRLLAVTSTVGASAVSTTLVSTTQTDGNGKYLFSNLPAGRYVMEFDKATLPANCSLSPNYQASGVPTDLNSDADPTTGRSPIIEIVPSDPIRQNILTVDAALVLPGCPTVPVCIPITIGKVVR